MVARSRVTAAGRDIAATWRRASATVDAVQRFLSGRPEVTTEARAQSDLPRCDPPAGGYRSPVIERLGTLAELTKGGAPGPNDHVGGAGDLGSLGG